MERALARAKQEEREDLSKKPFILVIIDPTRLKVHHHSATPATLLTDYDSSVRSYLMDTMWVERKQRDVITKLSVKILQRIIQKLQQMTTSWWCGCLFV